MAYTPIAIIGYGCSFPPDGKNTEKFFENVLNNTSGIREMPRIYWNTELYYDSDRKAEDKTYCKLGGIIPDYQFPYELAEQLGIKREAIKAFNRTELMTLDTIIQGILSSKRPLNSYGNDKTGFYLGNMLGDAQLPNYVLKNRIQEVMTYLGDSEDFRKLSSLEQEAIKKQLTETLHQRLSWQPQEDIELYQSSLLKSIQRLLNIQGNHVMVDGACSGSVLVIDEAIKSIHEGKIHTCITSAVLGNMVVTGNVAFAKVGGLTATGTYPLDHRTGGLVSGEGAGTIILKDLNKAVEDGDKIYGVIRSSGVASDGKGQSIYAPSTKGQLGAMEKSLKRAELMPEDIDYVETHATGTLVGDMVELNTLKTLFSKVTGKKIAIGSIKSQIGHAFSAAGMANLIKVLEGMRREIMPPTHNFERFPDGIDLESTPLYVNTEVKRWEKKDELTPRRAMVNAFGFGGINANLILEEYIPAYHQQLIRDQEIVHPFDIAIVGIGCFDFMAENKEQWWEEMKQGIAPPKSIPKDRWNETVAQLFDSLTGYFIEKISFPFIRFKIPPATLRQIDRSQQIALMASYEAINEYGLDKIPEERTGVYVGAMLGLESALLTDLRIRLVEYLDILEKTPEFKALNPLVQDELKNKIRSSIREYIAKVEEDTLPGYMDNIIAGRISNYFNIRGTNAVYDCDSLSFYSALDQGVYSLISGENDVAVIGGVHTNLMPEWLQLFNAYKEDPKHRHTVNKLGLEHVAPAEGAVFYVLKRMSDVKDNEKVYGRITDLKIKTSDTYNNPQENGVKPFYFGAEAGFSLLKNLLSIREGTEKKVVQQGLSLYGNMAFELTLCHRDYQEAEKVSTITQQKTPSCYVKYYVGKDQETLLKALLEDEETPFDKASKEEIYRMAIVYRTAIELERKKKLVQANLMK